MTEDALRNTQYTQRPTPLETTFPPRSIVAPPVILPAGWRDLFGVLQLEKACFGRDAWPVMDVFAALTWPGVLRLKVDAAGLLAGFIAADLREGGELAWITTLGVHPEFRRRGWGEQLLRECEGGLRAKRVRLSVRAGNLPAQQLYLKRGYQQVQVWRKYYSGEEDGVVMEKQLLSRATPYTGSGR